jgi:hypothetical protein
LAVALIPCGCIESSWALEQVKRLKERIPMRNPAHRYWTRKEIALLGTMPDHDLARRLQRHPSSVVSKRLALGVRYRCPRYRWWKPGELKLLGGRPDADIARLTSRSVRAIRLKRMKLGIPNRFDRRFLRGAERRKRA